MISVIEPPVMKNGLYSIGETADLIGVHRHTLDKYEKELKIIKSERSVINGRRIFRGKEIVRCWRALRRTLSSRNQC